MERHREGRADLEPRADVVLKVQRHQDALKAILPWQIPGLGAQQHRGAAALQNALGDAPDQGLAQTGASVLAHRDQVNSELGRVRVDRGSDILDGPAVEVDLDSRDASVEPVGDLAEVMRTGGRVGNVRLTVDAGRSVPFEDMQDRHSRPQLGGQSGHGLQHVFGK